MNAIAEIGPLGILVIGLQAVLFFALVKASSDVHSNIRPLLRGLSASLAEFKDNFGDEDNIVTRARTRYRRALEQIEKVDTALITSSMLSYTEVTRLFGIRLRFTDFDQFYRSGPSTLITLGLLGTFLGLTGNLDELSKILDAATSSPAEGLLRASAILGPMATAFISSLVAVALSIILWIIGTVRGTPTLVADLNELMGAYLDQVVQANSKRYSLMRESLERMEIYLTEFLSKFRDSVGAAIEEAMNLKIGQVFDSIAQSAYTYARYVDFLNESSTQLQIAATSFDNASKTFASSSFATDFGASTEKFLESTSAASDSSRRLAGTSYKLQEILSSINDSCRSGSQYFGEMDVALRKYTETVGASLEAVQTNSTALLDATKQLREARLAVGREARATEKLVSSVLTGLEALEENMKRISESFDLLSSREASRDNQLLRSLNAIQDQNAKLTESLDSKLQSILDRIATELDSRQATS